MALLALAGVAWAADPASGSHAAFASAGKLRTLCLGRGAARATCLGYLTGSADLLRHPAVRDALRPHTHAACLPDKLKAEQIRLLFLNHMHEHPGHAERAAAQVVWQVLKGAFPCPQPAPRKRPEPGATHGRERPVALQRSLDGARRNPTLKH